MEINGSLAARHHYGYAPFYADLTRLAAFGEENRITVNVNTGMQPNSRWYTGSGLYRGVTLCHGPKVHIVPDGIFAFTREIADGYAFLEIQAETENASPENRLAEVTVFLEEEGGGTAAKARRVIYIGAGGRETARIRLNVKNPKLWDAEKPNLYRVRAAVRNLGEYRTHFEPAGTGETDGDSVLFGIRTVTADAVRGLRVNGKEVKLKGGCIHHDNAMLGARSYPDAELRKIALMKSGGYNAVRTAPYPCTGPRSGRSGN